MLIADEDLRNQLLSSSTERNIRVEIADVTVNDENILSESLELTTSILDESEFKLGGCVASQLVLQLVGVNTNLNNRRINVFIYQSYTTDILYPSDTLYPSDDLHPFYDIKSVEYQIFSGTIMSSKRQKNRSVVEIIAFDDLYKMSQLKCGVWFRNYIKYGANSTITLRNLVYQALDQYDLRYDIAIIKDISLGFNDDVVLSLSSDLAENVVKDDLTIADILKAYCELNACFARISPTGKVQTLRLYKQANSVATDKKDINETVTSYSDLTCEEFVTGDIKLISFIYNKDKVYKYGYSDEKKSWYVSDDNIITKCCTDISELVRNFNDKSGNNYIFTDLYSYKPFSVSLFGEWWIETGDKVKIKTTFEDIPEFESFVFSRKLKGINGMKVSLESKGNEFLGKDEIGSE